MLESNPSSALNLRPEAYIPPTKDTLQQFIDCAESLFIRQKKMFGQFGKPGSEYAYMVAINNRGKRKGKIKTVTVTVINTNRETYNLNRSFAGTETAVSQIGWTEPVVSRKQNVYVSNGVVYRKKENSEVFEDRIKDAIPTETSSDKLEGLSKESYAVLNWPRVGKIIGEQSLVNEQDFQELIEQLSQFTPQDRLGETL